MNRWYRGMPRVAVDVECGGEVHEVVWKRGRLAIDHHDIAAERALEALGGEPTGCLDLYRRWRELCATTKPTDAITEPTSIGLRSTSRAPSPASQALDELPPGLREVMALIALVRAGRSASADGRATPAVPPRVHRMLTGRLDAALRASLEAARRAGGRTRVTAELAVLPIGDQPGVVVEGSARRMDVHLALPAGWLVEVAGRSSGFDGPRLLLSLRPPRGLAVRWDVASGRVVPRLVAVTVEPDGRGGWRVATESPATGGAYWSVQLR